MWFEKMHFKDVLDVFSALDAVYFVTESYFDQNQLILSLPLCQWVLIAPLYILCNIFLLMCSTRIQTLELILGIYSHYGTLKQMLKLTAASRTCTCMCAMNTGLWYNMFLVQSCSRSWLLCSEL